MKTLLNKDNKYILIALGLFVGLYILFYFTLFSIIARKNKTKLEEQQELNTEMLQYYGEMFGSAARVDMDRYYSDIIKLKNNKKINVDSLMTKLKIKPTQEFITGKGEENPGAYFKKILDQKREELLKLAGRMNSDIPEDLGFGEELPPNDEAADMLRFLYIKDQLVRISLRSGVKGVTALEHFDAVKTGADVKNLFIKEYPVQMIVRGELASILKILFRLRSDNRFLVLRNMKVMSENEEPDDLEKDLLIAVNVAGMMFTEVTDEDLKPKVKTKSKIKVGVPKGF